jgi:RHS repeat-associated protein
MIVRRRPVPLAGRFACAPRRGTWRSSPTARVLRSRRCIHPASGTRQRPTSAGTSSAPWRGRAAPAPAATPETGFTGASTPNQTGGFTFLRNRWYDAQSGRFLTQDPIGLAGGVNLYAYAGNNPVSFSDPYGLRADSLKVNGSMSQKAVTWLMANSPTARKTLEAIAGDDRVSLTIRDPISSVEAGTGEMLFAPEGSTKGTILLNPVGTNQANFDLPQGSSWIHTVASDLAHEIGHAAGHFGHASSACAGDPAPGGTGCIINYENKVRQELTGGSGGGVRTEY